MKRYIALIVLFLCYGLGTRADNSIALSTVQGAAGSEVTVSISMTNTDAVSALQISIPLDDNLTFVANSQEASARLIDHSLTIGVYNGVLNVMVFSNTMAAIRGNSGELCTFKLLLGNIPGTISLQPSTTAVTGTDGSAVETSTIAGSVDVRGARIMLNRYSLSFSRVAIGSTKSNSVSVKNIGNEPLVISDISFSSSMFSAGVSLPLTIEAGNTQWITVKCSPVARGDINAEMTIISNDLSSQGIVRLSATPYAVNELKLGNASGYTGEAVIIPLTMKNYDPINGLQMEMVLPQTLEYEDGSFVLSGRKVDHQVSATVVNDTLRIVAFSLTGESFTGSDGEVGSFRVKILGSSNVSLNLYKASLTSIIDGKTTNVLSANNGCTISVMSPRINMSNKLNLSTMSVKQQDGQSSFSIRNSGPAPLVISDIVLNDEQLSLKEELPLTIEASSSKNLTIVCNPTHDGDINTTMEIYSNDPNNRRYVVQLTGNVFAPNYLSAEAEAYQNGVRLSVSLDNYSDIYGIQFDVETDHRVVANGSSVQVAERSKGFTTAISPIAENTFRVAAYSFGGQGITSGDGKVLTIALRSGEPLSTDGHTLTISGIKLSSVDMKNKYAGYSTVVVDYHTGSSLLGDANGDGEVDVNDITAVVNYIQGNAQSSFNIETADVNNDGEIDVNDITGIVNIIQQ